jgi:hypothetical protein
MKRALVVLLAVACATGSDPDVGIHLEQITTFSSLRFAGPVNVEYRVTISNKTDAPVTLTRVDLNTVGQGAYVLREPPLPLRLTVPPKSSVSAAVTARGSALGGRATGEEPVTVRMVAYFDGPGGALTRVTNTSFEQTGRD